MTDTASDTPTPGADSPSLFDQPGGEPAVAAVVDAFHDKVLGDPGLKPYFAGVDLDRLKQHQRRFTGQALGAQRPYSGRSMRKAHENLSLTEPPSAVSWTTWPPRSPRRGWTSRPSAPWPRS